MTKLLINQRVFSWTDTYDVYDENGNPKYFVKADIFTIGHRIRIFSHATNREIGCIRERVFAFLAKADVSVGGLELGTITGRFTLFRPEYSIDYNGWDIEGDFLGRDYSIIDGSGDKVAVISRELFYWGDTYAVNVYDSKDELEVLITAITIDMMNCGGN